MKKILASILTIAMLISTMSACVIPASAEEADLTAGVNGVLEVIYDIDFEKYAVDNLNWLEQGEAGLLGQNNYTPAGANIQFEMQRNDANAHLITVVNDDFANEQGKVLKIAANGVGANLYSRIRPVARVTHDQMLGKKLVYSAKLYFPNGFKTNDIALLATKNSHGLRSPMETIEFTGKFNPAGEFYPVYEGSSAGNSAGSVVDGYAGRNVNTTAEPQYGKWVEIKYVVDLSKPVSAENSNTARVWYDDHKNGPRMIIGDFKPENTHKTNPNYDFIMQPDGAVRLDHFQNRDFCNSSYTGARKLFEGEYEKFDKFLGTMFYINGTGDAANNTYYIDDLKAYLIEPLDYEMIGDFDNYTSGPIKLKFNQKINPESKSYGGYTANFTNEEHKGGTLKYVRLVKDGDEVTDGLKSVTLEEDGKTVTIIPSDNLEQGCEYQLVLSSFLTDVHGQGLNNNSTDREITLTTAKSSSLYAEATAEVDESTVTADVTLVNPTANSLNVWAAVAVYGEFNEMIGFTPITKEVGASKTIEEENVTVEVKEGSTVKTVKLFVWDSYETMKPYHAAETLYSDVDAQ